MGSKAPDFTLKTKTAEGLVDVTLSSNFGKKNTVLLFFPLAYTGVCTQEMCDVTAGLGDYTKLNAEVYAISVDSPFSQEAWATQNGIKVTILSDLNKTVTRAYDVLFPMLAGVGDTSARAAFVINSAGVITYAEQTPTPKDLPNFKAIAAVLAK
ncbi:MAG: redoxin domain-containing protein [Verrucomicrobia bacterium]|nr:MAG: redoxin domain-containing protein [Verrucomicrobiota bacterium]